MTREQILAALAAVGMTCESVNVYPNKAVLDFDSGFELKFTDLCKLSEALGTDKININTETGWYGEHSHEIEILW